MHVQTHARTHTYRKTNKHKHHKHTTNTHTHPETQTDIITYGNYSSIKCITEKGEHHKIRNQPKFNISFPLRKYQNAEQDDLWQYLTTAAHEDNTLPADVSVKKIMDTWTLQMGYPVIKVTRSSDGTSATVTQVSVYS